MEIRVRAKKVTDKKGSKYLVDQSGHRVSLDAAVEDLEDGAIVLMEAVGNRHEEAEFNYELSKEIVRHQKVNGIFTITDGRKCKIYTTSATGEWCIMGTLPDGSPSLWNRKGKHQSGDPFLDLCIWIEVEPQKKQEKEETQEEAAQQAAEEEPAGQEPINPLDEIAKG